MQPSDFWHVRSAPVAGMMTGMSNRYAIADLQRRLLMLEELLAYAAQLRREREARRLELECVLEPAQSADINI